MSDDDVSDNIIRARELQARAKQLRDEAAPLREKLNETFQRRSTETAIAVDSAARAEKLAKAELDVATTDAADRAEEATMWEKQRAEALKEAARLEAAGDAAGAAEQREFADKNAARAEGSLERARLARLEVAEAHEKVGTATRERMEAEEAFTSMGRDSAQAEANLDLLEDQAALVDQARMKLIEADIKYGGDIPPDADLDEWITSKAALEEEAEQLLRKADAIKVDREEIDEYVAPPAPTGNDTHPLDQGDVLGTNAVDSESPSDTQPQPDPEEPLEPEPQLDPEPQTDPATPPAWDTSAEESALDAVWGDVEVEVPPAVDFDSGDSHTDDAAGVMFDEADSLFGQAADD